MKAKDIRDLTDAELASKEGELKEELFNLRFRLATGQLDNPLAIKAVKKDIARVKTIIRQRDIKKEMEQAL